MLLLSRNWKLTGYRHWVDKNCFAWSQGYFKEKLVGVEGSSSTAEAQITGVKSCEGDVDVCQRKGKVISLFDLKLVLNFEGRLSTTTDEDVKGEISIPEVAYDSEESDYVFKVSSVKHEAVRDVVKKEIIPQLRKLLFQFGKDLIAEHGAGIQHPANEVESSFTRGNTASQESEKAGAASSAGASSASSPSAAGTNEVPKYNTEGLVKTETTFHASAADIYDVFLDPARVAAWSRSTPIIKPEQGFKYTLFGGNISGTIQKLAADKSQIVMTWRLREWKEGHAATLTLDFVQGSDDTKCKIGWTGIPLGEADVVKRNFEEYYIKPIKITFGYGAVL